jgi:ribonuclease Z
MNLRKTALIILLTAAVTLSIAYVLRAQLILAIAPKVAAQRLAANTLNELPDGLHVGLCGAGSPFPDERRSGPCTLVVAGKRLFIFDTGSGSVRNIAKMGFVHGNIEAIFLTHFHSDHIDGLGEMLLQRWVSTSNRAPVPLYGPVGVETVAVGVMQAYSFDHIYRVAHHGDVAMPAAGFGATAKQFTPPDQGALVLIKDADLEIVAFNVDHAPVHPAVGYRVRYKGRSVLISGDTRKSANLQREAAGVDLLVHEALSAPLVNALGEGAAVAGRTNLKKLFADIIDYHSSPEEAAEVALDAKVGYLLYNHIAPPLPLPGMEKAFVGRAGDIYSGPIRVGVDGDFISMPVGSDQIRASRRF